MSKKKSLGSSPIGFKSNNSSMGFIPDLGVSRSRQTKKTQYSSSTTSNRQKPIPNEPKKKVVSYSLEITLVDRIKTTADRKEMFYSSLVSQALKSWLAQNG